MRLDYEVAERRQFEVLIEALLRRKAEAVFSSRWIPRGKCQVFCVNDLDFVVALGFGFGFGFVVALGFCVVVGFGDGVQGKGAIGVHPKSETGD